MHEFAETGSEFPGGRTAWREAAEAAIICGSFRQDDDDELVADEPVSCYNCRMRRWTVDSFVCMRPVKDNG